MNRLASLFVFFICLFWSQATSENYIMLTNASLNIGKEINNFDFNVGVGFYYNQNKSVITSSYDYKNPTLTDTSFIYNNVSTLFEIIPGINISYYFSNKTIRPFLQLATYVPIPIYNRIESYEGITNRNEFQISTGILAGIDYRIDKVSIGGGIGPFCSIDNSDYTFTDNLDPTIYNSQSTQYKNTSISINLDVQVRIKYYF